MNRQQLTLQVCRQLGNLNTMLSHLARNLITIILAVGGNRQVKQGRVSRHLDTHVPEISRPFRHVFQGIKRRISAGKLCQEYRGAFHFSLILIFNPFDLSKG